jgi:hypothetical protein
MRVNSTSLQYLTAGHSLNSGECINGGNPYIGYLGLPGSGHAALLAVVDGFKLRLCCSNVNLWFLD